jgi:hypothetical protein
MATGRAAAPPPPPPPAAPALSAGPGCLAAPAPGGFRYPCGQLAAAALTASLKMAIAVSRSASEMLSAGMKRTQLS